MKNLLIASVLALMILFLCAGGIRYVAQATQEMDAHLARCIRDFATPAKAAAALDEAQKAWDAHRKILMMYTDQELLDEIDDHLAHLQALAEHHREEFVPTVILCRGRLKELKQREAISVYSWF